MPMVERSRISASALRMSFSNEHSARSKDPLGRHSRGRLHGRAYDGPRRDRIDWDSLLELTINEISAEADP